MDIVLNLVIAHWQDVLAVFGALVALASVIVKITPTQTDDAFLAKVVEWADRLSIAYPKPTVKAEIDEKKG